MSKLGGNCYIMFCNCHKVLCVVSFPKKGLIAPFLTLPAPPTSPHAPASLLYPITGSNKLSCLFMTWYFLQSANKQAAAVSLSLCDLSRSSRLHRNADRRARSVARGPESPLPGAGPPGTRVPGEEKSGAFRHKR